MSEKIKWIDKADKNDETQNNDWKRFVVKPFSTTLLLHNVQLHKLKMNY